MNKYFYLLALLFLVSKCYSQEFITRWDLSSPSVSAITFTIESTGPVSYIWETIPAGSTGSGTITGTMAYITGMPLGSMIRLKIDTANFRHFKMYQSPNQHKLKDVEQWGAVHWTSMDSTFYLCDSLNISATDIPDLSLVTSTVNMFYFCGKLTGPNNIGSWNTQTIHNMKGMFYNAVLFNQNIGAWNTGVVQNMNGMFYGDYSFNQNIGNWNTSSVLDVGRMFSFASAFNQPIGNWNTSLVQNMFAMFQNATSFNQPIGNWNTGAVQNMGGMFESATSFNQPVGNWNTQLVTNMSAMFDHASAFNQNIGSWNTGMVQGMQQTFNNATSFNQPIGNWNTGMVRTMQSMFGNATSFNQPIGNWNTGKVKYMGSMFELASLFNQPIGNWNTDSVQDMGTMFQNATSFNQPIGNWNTDSVKYMYSMFHNATSFNQPIGNWNTGAVTNMISMFSNATSFNQPIGNWNTAAVAGMSKMFLNATSFNQTLGTWQLKANVGLTNMFDSSGINCSNYSNTLIGWSNNSNVPSGRTLGAVNMFYESSAIPNRNLLINTKGWTILGDTLSSGLCDGTSVSQYTIDRICSISPNPATEQALLSIQSDKTQEVSVVVYSNFGVLVFEDKIHLHQGDNSYILNTNHWSDGNYMVRTQTTSNTFINRLVVSR